jgi:hypothetical protein
MAWGEGKKKGPVRGLSEWESNARRLGLLDLVSLGRRAVHDLSFV